jgi:hypothetical protein
MSPIVCLKQVEFPLKIFVLFFSARENKKKMDSKAEGLRQSMLEKQRQKIYEESEKERQKNAKV